MEKRQTNRFEHRLACRVASGGARSPGIIRDVSELGLFLETPARPALNSIVQLYFRATLAQPEFSFEAGVTRTCPPQVEVDSTTGIGTGAGIGLEVLPPKTAFERWVVRPARPEPPSITPTLAPLGGQPQGGMGKYRVRLIRQDRPGTQILTLRCESEAMARAKALMRLGGIWRVAESQRL